MSNPQNSSEPQPDPQMGALLAEAGWVLALAKRLARDQAAAEDIAQGALVLALERRPAIGGGLRPWLAKVVGRLARRTVRSDVRRQDREAQAAPALGSKSVGTDEVLERFELQQELARRVDSLQKPYRGVLIRRYYEGLSVKEIARATGASPATVRSQLARGLEHLRLQYDNEFESRGALGIFLIAAGSGTGFISRRTAELVLMQTSTKVAAATAAALLVLLAVIGPEFSHSDAAPESNLETQAALDEHAQLESDTSSIVNDPAAESGRVAMELEAAETEGPVPVEEPTRLVTTLRARILGENGEPLGGATLTSIYPDGRSRGTSNLAYTDGDGRVVLELADDAVRKSRSQTYDMLFTAAAADHATTFVVKQLRLHGETDLGEIRLALGGSLIGFTVDAAGQPIAGATLFAAVSVMSKDPNTLKITGPDSDVPRPRAISAADGSFDLSGIQALRTEGRAATARIWAHAPGYLWTLSGSFPVTPRGLVDVGQVVLEEVPPKFRIDGVVLRPDGSPAAGASVNFSSKGAPYNGKVETDSQGAFLVVGKDDSPINLVAEARSYGGSEGSQLGMSATVTAERGEKVELRLTQRRVVSVTVIDMEGEPIEDVHLRPVLSDGLVPGVGWVYTDEAGLVNIEAPGSSFTVWARKSGHGEARTDTLEHASAPEALTITMQTGMYLRGRVLAYGKPVAGATVSVMGRYEDFVAMTGGFPNRYASGVSSVTTDTEGKFTAPVKRRWSAFGVVVRSEGFATWEVMFDAWSSEDADDIEIHLTKGGAIEGTVTPPPGMKVAGLYVGASRGDGWPLSTITDARGRYRFEGLTPGNWRVEGRLREVGTEMLSISRHPEDMDPHWNAVVTDGKTLELDVDMRELGDVEVRGQLRIDGAPAPRGWTAEVVRQKHEHHLVETPAVELDRDGRFAFTTRPGRVDLRLVGPVPGGATIEMFREVRLKGPLFEWDGKLSTAPVDEWLDDYPERARFVRGDEKEGDRELTLVAVGGDGVVKARVPVGSSSLQVPSKDDPSGKTWDAIQRVDVP